MGVFERSGARGAAAPSRITRGADDEILIFLARRFFPRPARRNGAPPRFPFVYLILSHETREATFANPRRELSPRDRTPFPPPSISCKGGGERVCARKTLLFLMESLIPLASSSPCRYLALPRLGPIVKPRKIVPFLADVTIFHSDIWQREYDGVL